MKIILASKSAVRKKILDQNNIKNEVIGSNVNEDEVKVDKIRNLKLDFISYDIEHIHNEKLQLIRKAGIPLLTWTVNDDKKLEKSREFADNCIFENIKP